MKSTLLRASCSCFFLSHYNFRWHAGTHNTKGRMIYSRQCLLSLWHSEKAYMRTIHWHLRVASCMTLIRIRKARCSRWFLVLNAISENDSKTQAPKSISALVCLRKFIDSPLPHYWILLFEHCLLPHRSSFRSLPENCAIWKQIGKYFRTEKGNFCQPRESFLCFFAFTIAIFRMFSSPLCCTPFYG